MERWGRTTPRILLSLVLVAANSLTTLALPPQDLVTRMVQAEINAAKLRQHFAYKRTERSTRTKGHLWVEEVVETPTGRMHRLLSVDGRPLTESENKAEDDRIRSLVQHPDDFRRENQARADDEARTQELLKMMSKAYLFEEAPPEEGCDRVNFKPNPAYQERTYQDRVLHAMAGHVLISSAPEYRLCKLDASLQHNVEFGYGLLGRVSQGSSFFMGRMQVSPGQWKTNRLLIRVDGNILLLKSVSRQEDSVHSDFKQVPYNISLQDAANMVNAAKF